MNIIVVGGTGFIGRYLIPALLQANHQVSVLGRNIDRIVNIHDQLVEPIDWQNFDKTDLSSVDVIINLAGQNIAQTRWYKDAKIAIKQSRTETSKTIANRLSQLTKNKQLRLYNASAVGVYGLQSPTKELPYRLTEATPIFYGHPTDFMSEVAQEWEQALKPAIDANVPVTIMRFGVVLKKNEGMLAQLTPSYKFGLGGKIGSGLQALSWIHIDDLINAILFLLQHPEITGHINLCAPECVTQHHFAKTLGAVLHRPTMICLPSWLIKLVFGQMGEELLLNGQNVYPQRLMSSGFNFNYPTLRSALDHEWE